MNPGCRDRHELQALSSSVHRTVVHVNNLRALLGIQFHDIVFEQLNSFLLRQNSREMVENSLHHCVDSLPQTDLTRHLGGVDGVEIETLGSNCAFHLVWQVRLEFLERVPFGVQDESRSRTRSLDHVKLAHVGCVPTCDIVTAFLDLVLGQIRIGTKAKMRHRNTTALVGIVGKVALGEQRCVVSDCFNRRLVRSHGTIGSKTPE
mmetsp:Transcript_15951/g.34717  ORF Transcript_15951/g.34717 Transcript_15951/m.34717 type:complete len:205 (-) Transcript_15951:119-733(-)